MSHGSMDSGWYYAKAGASAGQEVGPLSWEELYLLAQSGRLIPADIVWNPKLPHGVAAGWIPGLFPGQDVYQEPSSLLPTGAAAGPAAPPESLPVAPPAAVSSAPWSTEPVPEQPSGSGLRAEPTQPQPQPQVEDVRPHTWVEPTDRGLVEVEHEEPVAPDRASRATKQGKAKRERIDTQKNRNLPWLVVLLVLILAAAGVAAYFLYFRDTVSDNAWLRTTDVATIDGTDSFTRLPCAKDMWLSTNIVSAPIPTSPDTPLRPVCISQCGIYLRG